MACPFRGDPSDTCVQWARGSPLPLSAELQSAITPGARSPAHSGGRGPGLAWRGPPFPYGFQDCHFRVHRVIAAGLWQVPDSSLTRTDSGRQSPEIELEEGGGLCWNEEGLCREEDGRVTTQRAAVQYYSPLIFSFVVALWLAVFPCSLAAEDQSLACAYAALILHDGGKSIEAVSRPILCVLVRRARSPSSSSAATRLGRDILLCIQPTRTYAGHPLSIISVEIFRDSFRARPRS
jgi:hypothetical protein